MGSPPKIGSLQEISRIMNPYSRRLAILLPPLLLIAACSSGEQHTIGLLNHRLETKLQPDISSGNLALQPLPDGARVTLLGPSQFPNGVQVLDERRIDVRAGVIEGLLDPKLMRIQIADTSTLPDDQRDARVREVTDYFSAYGLGSTLQPTMPLQAVSPGSAGAVVPAGLTITISVACPHHDTWSGYGYGDGKSRPVCD